MSLKDVVGLELSRPNRTTGGFPTETSLLGLELSVLQEVGGAQRPEILQLERRLEVRRSENQVARAGWLATVDLVAGGQVQPQTNDFRGRNEDRLRRWNTGVAVRVPLLDAMRAGAIVQLAWAVGVLGQEPEAPPEE